MKKNKILKIVVISLFFVIILSGLFVINMVFKFDLKGEKSIQLDVYSSYKEQGYEAYLFNNDVSERVKIKSNLDTNKIGTYEINYTFNLFGINHKLTRNVKVVDKEKPIITLNGEDTIYLYKGDEYIENGAKAQDNYDGDLTNQINMESNVDTKNKGEYNVIYTVKDSSLNSATINRKIVVTTSKNIKINNPMLNYIAKNNYDISLGYYNLVTGDSYFYNENKVYFAASLIKTVEALYLYDNNMVDDDIKKYIKKAITVSDNPSHHYLQKIIGKDNLKKYGESLGAKYTLSGGGVCGNTTVNDQLIFLKRLYQITKDDNEELKSWFINDYANSINFNNEIKVMHKYGLYDNVYHDVGIVLDEEPYIIVVLTGIPSGYTKIVNNLSKIVYEYHTSI